MKISVKHRILEVNLFPSIRDFQPYDFKIDCGKRSLSSISMSLFFAFQRKTLFHRYPTFCGGTYGRKKTRESPGIHTTHTRARAHTAGGANELHGAAKE